jgi:hypothetical protein
MRLLAALRALAHRLVVDGLAALEPVAAGTAFVFIRNHGRPAFPFLKDVVTPNR